MAAVHRVRVRYVSVAGPMFSVDDYHLTGMRIET
jgi:hypothetical protein